LAQGLPDSMATSAESHRSLDHLHPFFIDSAHYDAMPATPTSQTLSLSGNNDMSNGGLLSDDHVSSMADPWAYQAEQPQLNYGEHDWAGIFTPYISQLTPITTQNDDKKQASACSILIHVDDTSSSPHPATSEGLEPFLEKPRRKQNHSCGPCRSAKRACDLPLSIAIHNKKPSVPYSMCSIYVT